MDGIDIKYSDFKIETLGKGETNNQKSVTAGGIGSFVSDSDRIVFHTHEKDLQHYIKNGEKVPSLELSGPRAKLFFDPKKTKVGIVTCGGLCPGLNSIIRSIVMTSYTYYGVTNVYGFRNGYQGLNPEYGLQPMKLYPDIVDNITELGGTILGSSRGPQDVRIMVNFLQEMEIDILFAVGGDGTMRGVKDLVCEIKKRGAKISVIGIPKTIDNDIAFIERSFGFETAVQEAKKVIYSAHVEAKGAPNGVGLVKLMGRESGFIAAYSTLAAPVVNYCFVPEVPFALEGTRGLFNVLEKRMHKRKHAVIVVAEGAGQDLIQEELLQTDASGNKRLKDIGFFLKEKIKEYFCSINMEINVKYIDPSYLIRSVVPTADDSAFCLMLAQNAVHAGMAGKTNMVVGFRNDHYVHLPVDLTTMSRKKINPEGRLWTSVLETIAQPPKMI